jgi:hypothetical protein
MVLTKLAARLWGQGSLLLRASLFACPAPGLRYCGRGYAIFARGQEALQNEKIMATVIVFQSKKLLAISVVTTLDLGE